jgi:uncharacterized protein (DUF302 family)
MFSGSVSAVESIVSIKSQHTVQATADRFENIIKSKGLTVFARVNHSDNAANVKLDLAPTEVIIFGNPKVGTPLMQCSKTVAIDLPQKALFWQDAEGQSWMSYNNPEYLKERHNIEGCDQVVNKISKVLGKLSKAAAK